MFVQDDFIQLYEQVKLSKDLLVYADFKIATPLEKLQQFIKSNKNDWVEAFAEYDETCIYRVSVDQFIEVLEVRKKSGKPRSFFNKIPYGNSKSFLFSHVFLNQEMNQEIHSSLMLYLSL